MSVAGILLLASLLTGCTSLVWAKPDGSREHVSRDAAACETEAQRQFPWLAAAPQTTDERERFRDQLSKREHFFESCMTAQGYTRQRGYTAW